VQVHYDEGVAIYIGPEPCVGVREDGDEASVGEGIGQPLSRESQSPGADAVSSAEGNTFRTHHRKVRTTRRGRRTWHVQTLLAREPGDLAIMRHLPGCSPQLGQDVARGWCATPYDPRRLRPGIAELDREVDAGLACFREPNERTAMTRTHFVEGQILFREGDPADSVFRLLSGTVDILRELDGDPILLGTVDAGQLIGEMGVVENRPRSATARAASEVEVEILTATEFLDQIAGSPRAARELIQRLSQRLREADDRIVNNERRSGRAHGTRTDANSQTAIESVKQAYLAAKNPWLQRQFDTPLGLGDLPFVVGRGLVAREGLPPLQPDLKLDDTVPFRLSRNHFMIEKRDGSYYVRDLRSTLGTIVNGQPIGEHFRGDDAPLRTGENEVIAGGVDSQFVFSVFIA
jgi:CRP/FNR family transcriptional regulator, cyclic AMP receptor protein